MLETDKILHNLYTIIIAQVGSNSTLVFMREKQELTDLNYIMNTPDSKSTRDSFPIRVVSLWNSSPEKIALAPTLNQFKTEYDRHFCNFSNYTTLMSSCKLDLDNIPFYVLCF